MNITKIKTIFEEVLEKGIPYDFHATDLYIPFTPDNITLVRKYNIFSTIFISEIDGSLWYDLPFCYNFQLVEKR